MVTPSPRRRYSTDTSPGLMFISFVGLAGVAATLAH